MAKFTERFSVDKGSLLESPLAWLVVIGLVFGLSVPELLYLPQLGHDLDRAMPGTSVWINPALLALVVLVVLRALLGWAREPAPTAWTLSHAREGLAWSLVVIVVRAVHWGRYLVLEALKWDSKVFWEDTKAAARLEILASLLYLALAFLAVYAALRLFRLMLVAVASLKVGWRDGA